MSPYGVDKELGGDNKKNDSWMEKCVEKVMAGGKDKGSAIAICKSQMKKNMSKSDFNYEDVSIERGVEVEYDTAIQKCAERMLETGNASTMGQARGYCESMFASSADFDKTKLYLDLYIFKK